MDNFKNTDASSFVRAHRARRDFGLVEQLAF
jgi:hypothetical protein